EFVALVEERHAREGAEQGEVRQRSARSRLAWPLSSHDAPHAATRFGGGEVGARRALAYLTLLCALPGPFRSPFFVLFPGLIPRLYTDRIIILFITFLKVQHSMQVLINPVPDSFLSPKLFTKSAL
ncbi:MAG: hypothetical protein R6X11_06325, partial [Desulfonatronovibrio sp.]